MTDSAPAPATSSPKIWRVGTLTYTLGGLVALYVWLLLGDFSWQMKERGTQPVVQVMMKHFHASDFVNGFLVLSLPAAIGLILTPIISYRSDRHRGRWGRRIPYLLVTAPMMTLALTGMAFSPVLGAWLNERLGHGPESLNSMVILVLGLSWTVLDFASVVAAGLFGALVNDVVPRELIGRFYGFFRVVSLGAGILFHTQVMGHAEEDFVPILTGIGLLFGVGITLMCVMVKEGDYPPPPEPVPGERRGFIVAVKGYFRDCFSKPHYLWIYALMALVGLAISPVNSFSVLIGRSYGLSLASYGNYVALTYTISLALAYPLGWMADRFHPVRMALWTISLYAVVMIVGFFFIKSPESYAVVFVLNGVLGGCYLTGAAALGQMLFPKLKYAEYASAGALLTAVGSIILGPAMGKLFDVLDHDYSYAFALGAVFAVLATGAGWVVYRRFVALGGTKGYVAPE